MIPIDTLSSDQARGVRGVFCDIDDTLTYEGKLVPEAFEALWALKNAGLRVVPVTGRPAGWCDCIVRQWPVDAVVGENGALLFYEEQGRLEEFIHPKADAESAVKFEQIKETVFKRVPGTRLAKDQAYRRFDLAIDFREEEPDLGFEAAEQIKQVFEEFGAHAKVSSIHVNGWFGDYDKLSMVRFACEKLWEENIDAVRDAYVFVGDSPNDAPMFEFFPLACGVANVKQFEAQLTAKPQFVATQAGGEGFAEIVATLLEKRA